MKKTIWILVVVLLFLHHDFWFWTDDRLVFGFLPVGLFYHIVISIAAASIWLLAVTFAWPNDLDETDDSRSWAARPTVREGEGTLRNVNQTIADDEQTVREDKTARMHGEQS